MNSRDIIKGIMHNGLENVFGRYYSSYRAFVHNNIDPDNLNRLQLLVPHLNAKIPDETWAYPKGNYSGKDYGIHCLPKIGDMVWVEFEFGNLDYPLWNFGHYAEGEKYEGFDNPNKFGFRTPRGSIVIFDDTEDKESISIKLKDYKDSILINLDLIDIDSKLINIGKENLEWVSKGETTKEKIEELWDAIGSLCDALVSHAHGGNGLSPPSTAGTIAQIKSESVSSKEKVEEILSEKTKIE